MVGSEQPGEVAGGGEALLWARNRRTVMARSLRRAMRW